MYSTLKHHTTLNVTHLFQSSSLFLAYFPITFTHLSRIFKRLEIPSWQKSGSWIRSCWRRAISTSTFLRNRPKQMICRQAWCFSTTLEHYTARIRHKRLQCFQWGLLEHPRYCVVDLLRPAVGESTTSFIECGSPSSYTFRYNYSL